MRIPDDYAKEFDLHDGTEVELTRVWNGLLLKQRVRDCSLDELLTQITPEKSTVKQTGSHG